MQMFHVTTSRFVGVAAILCLLPTAASANVGPIAVVDPTSKLAALVAIVVVLITFSRRGRKIVQEQRDALAPILFGNRRVDPRGVELKSRTAKPIENRRRTTIKLADSDRRNIRLHSVDREETV